MNVLRFQARNAAEAVRQIHAQLGAEAVVLSVTPLPARGVGRLWCRPRLEVLAGVPEAQMQSQETRGEGKEPGAGRQALEPESQSPGLSDRAQHLSIHHSETVTANLNLEVLGSEMLSPPGLGGSWRSGAVLHRMGLVPLHVEKVLERARTLHGDLPPASFAGEVALVRRALASFWRPPPRHTGDLPPVHVFVGPPGSGKTTVLCKWLAKAVLAEGLTARAWRLDSRAANFPGLLDFYGEILGVEVEREWRGQEAFTGCEAGFVDLPGTVAQDAAAVQQLGAKVGSLAGVRVHLVLNAAYDASSLLAQARAFASLPVSDLIVTHMDEELRPGKLWNLVLGTNFAISYLSGGQNIPGAFAAASPESLISRENRSFTGSGELGKALAEEQPVISCQK